VSFYVIVWGAVAKSIPKEETAKIANEANRYGMISSKKPGKKRDH
jgi:hypothetical protein